MPAPQRLVVFVEGQSEVIALPSLVGRLLDERQAWDGFFLDDRPLRVGGLERLTEAKSEDWLRYLRMAHSSRLNLGGVLLLLDGDHEHAQTPEGRIPFCAMTIARQLADQAKAAGAGELFSVAVVFAPQEYESWLIAGIPSLHERLKPKVELPRPENLEKAPRDAKGWLSRSLKDGYKPTQHQAKLTRLLDFDLLRSRMRSFRRLDHAIQELTAAVRSGQPMVSPGGTE